MSKRCSKLQKRLYNTGVEGLNIQIHASVYRMDSHMGSTDIPRYFITLNKEVIWDYPKMFRDSHPERDHPSHFTYTSDMNAISNIIEDFIQTPREDLLSKEFKDDHWGLVNILRAMDRRLNVKKVKRKTNNIAARKVIDVRENLSSIKI